MAATVMSTTRACDVGTTLAADERFVELICADEALLRAEFDAIIAAEWPSPPPDEPDQGADAERGPRKARRHPAASVATRSSRSGNRVIRWWTHQRSPPPRTALAHSARRRPTADRRKEVM